MFESLVSFAAVLLSLIFLSDFVAQNVQRLSQLKTETNELAVIEDSIRTQRRHFTINNQMYEIKLVDHAYVLNGKYYASISW